MATSGLIALMAVVALTACDGSSAPRDGAATSPPAESPSEHADVAVVAAIRESGPVFEPAAFTVAAGELTFSMDNVSIGPHTLLVEGMESEMRLFTAAAKYDTGSITLEPGTYTFYCDVQNHRADGMEGTLTVE